MVSGLIKGNARGYFLQHGESGLKGYLESEIENENLTGAEAENLYKEYTGMEEKFGRKETVKISAPKSVEIIKQEKPEVPLPEEDKKEDAWYTEGAKRRKSNSPEVKTEKAESYEVQEKSDRDLGFEVKYGEMSHDDLVKASNSLWEEYAVTGNTDLLPEYEYLKNKGYETSNEKVLRWKADNAGEKADEAWTSYRKSMPVIDPGKLRTTSADRAKAYVEEFNADKKRAESYYNRYGKFAKDKAYWKGLADEARQREIIAEFETPAKEDKNFENIVADKSKKLKTDQDYAYHRGSWIADVINGHTDVIDRYQNQLQPTMYATEGNTFAYGVIAQKTGDANGDYGRIQEMSENERNTFLYWFIKGGEEKAIKYFDSIAPILDKRVYAKETEKARKEAVKHPVLANVKTVGSNIVNAPGTFGTFLKELVSPDEFNPYAPGFKAQYISEAVREETSKNIENPVGRFLYNTGMSMADSAVVMPMGGAGIAFLGMNAAVSEGRKTAIEGGSNSQILIKGITAGIFEAAFEKIGIDNLFKPKAVGSLADVFMTILKQGGIEASEEFCTSLANIVTDNVTMGGESQFNKLVRGYMGEGFSYEEASGMAYVDMAGEVGMETLSGFVSGLFFGGADASIQYNSNTSVGEVIT